VRERHHSTKLKDLRWPRVRSTQQATTGMQHMNAKHITMEHELEVTPKNEMMAQ
jgi:hypothetical protein